MHGSPARRSGSAATSAGPRAEPVPHLPERRAEAAVIHPQEPVRPAQHRLRHHPQRFLRHHALVRPGLAAVAEAAEGQAMGGGADAGDALLQAHVGRLRIARSR